LFKIATWNVNSLRVRLEQVLEWLAHSKADVLALQETKLTDENFPKDIFLEQGYQVAFIGQKTYNGVCIISKHPLAEVVTEVPGYQDEARRVIAATIADLRLINLYVPNGSALGTDKYAYKLRWLAAIEAFIKNQLAVYPKLAVVGDFNIAPEAIDVHAPEEWEDTVLFCEEMRRAFDRLKALGLVDSFRLMPRSDEQQQYSWWDYRQGSFRRNRGLRIDHILLSHGLSKSCLSADVDINPRKSAQPSDHAPVFVCLDDAFDK